MDVGSRTRHVRSTDAALHNIGAELIVCINELIFRKMPASMLKARILLALVLLTCRKDSQLASDDLSRSEMIRSVSRKKSCHRGS